MAGLRSGKQPVRDRLLRKSVFLAVMLAGVPAIGAVVAVSHRTDERASASPVSSNGKAVSSVEQLQRILKAAQDGDVILLASGYYPKVVLTGIHKTGTVTVMSAESSRPAAIGDLLIRDCSGLTLQGLELAPSASSLLPELDGSRGQPDQPAAEEGGRKGLRASRFRFVVTNSQRIVLNKLDVHGPQGDPQLASRLRPILVRDSGNVTVSNSRFSHMWHGLEMLNLDGFRAIGNDFSNLRTDGIRGGNSSNIEIAHNVMTDFFPAPGDHPDGIQLWALPHTTTMENISIHDNLVVRGRGASTQGIFIRDVRNNFTFRNLSIRNNLVMGGLGNGIALNSVDGAVIEGNRVINYPDRKTSWIRVDNARHIVLQGNRAPRYFITRSEVEESRNKVDNPRKIDEPLLVSQWLDAQPGRRRADSALQASMTDRRDR